jgi:hypothetical protein
LSLPACRSFNQRITKQSRRDDSASHLVYARLAGRPALDVSVGKNAGLAIACQSMFDIVVVVVRKV